MVHEFWCGYGISTALRNALPDDENSVSDTCLTLEYSELTTGMRVSSFSHSLTT